MYADDTKYFSRINCLADVDAFQQNTDKLLSWSCDWQLCFNTLKCKVVIIIIIMVIFKCYFSESS